MVSHVYYKRIRETRLWVEGSHDGVRLSRLVDGGRGSGILDGQDGRDWLPKLRSELETQLRIG